MNEFLMFLMENYVWILVVIVIIIITVIGFLADKKKTPKKIEIKEETPPVSMDVPTFIHDSATEKKVENQFVWNNMPQKKEELEDSKIEHQENNMIDNEIKLPEENTNQFINPQMNMLNNGMQPQNANPTNNYNNQNTQQFMNNQNNMNNYSNGMNMQSQRETVMPTPVKNTESLNVQMSNTGISLQNTNNHINGMNPQMNMLNSGIQSQNVNPMNNYNNQNNINNYKDGMNLQRPISNPQMNMLNNGMQSQNVNPMNNYNNQNMNPIMNNQGNVQPSVGTTQSSNITIPQPANMMGQNQPQPTMNNQIPVNNTPVHEPIKVTPIPGMTGTAVSFVNGPTNIDSNQQ